jgi:hypothetical protein
VANGGTAGDGGAGARGEIIVITWQEAAAAAASSGFLIT